MKKKQVIVALLDDVIYNNGNVLALPNVQIDPILVHDIDGCLALYDEGYPVILVSTREDVAATYTRLDDDGVYYDQVVHTTEALLETRLTQLAHRLTLSGLEKPVLCTTNPKFASSPAYEVYVFGGGYGWFSILRDMRGEGELAA